MSAVNTAEVKQCCSLSNPSSDQVALLNQKCYLKKLVGNLATPPQSHRCTMSICVSPDALEQSVKNLPNTFCFKVSIPESNIPFAIDVNSEQNYRPQVQVSDVAKTILERYVSDPLTVVTVLDTTEPTLTSAQFVRQCAETLNAPDPVKILVLTVGRKLVPSAWSEGLGLGLEHTMLQYVDPNDVLAIVTHCKRHVLTGNLTGWWGAVLSGSPHVICPDPWTPGIPFDTLSPNSEWKSVKCGWNYTKYFDHAYYINLDRRTDRRAHMDSQLQKFGLSATRVAAVDGKALQWKPEYGVLSNYWNSGAFAYCLSYRVAIIDAMQKGYDNVLIMDDDCVLQDNLWQVLDKAWTELPEEWHMLYFGANHGHPQPANVPTEQDRIGDHIYRLKGSMGSHAIILNKKCFKTILGYVAAPYAPLDMFFSMYHKFFPCYITYPGLATQMPGVSDIINQEVNYTKDWGVDYINHIPSRT